MRLNKLSLKDKGIFIKYLNLSQHTLASYSFQNIYIWGKLFDISWAKIQECLCVFFKDKIGTFLYLPPQAKQINPEAVGEVFKIMHRENKNKEISRIENVEESDISIYRSLGYDCKEKFSDYLCRQTTLASLRGNRLKHKRAGCNYFRKHYQFQYLPFSLGQREECLYLYNCWMQERSKANTDPVYRGMLLDSYNTLETLLDNYSDLDYSGRVVKIENRIKAFTFGFKLNVDTFCIAYEVCVLSVKGLAQFIFREFCRELADYTYINIMDDSGLENLKRVKLSYQPVKLVPAYIVRETI